MPGEFTPKTENPLLIQSVQSTENLSQETDHVLEVFINQGLLSLGEQGEFIFHIDKWKQPLNFSQFDKDLGKATWGPKGHPSLMHILRNYITNLQGYSQEDYALYIKGEFIPPKKLLYWPETADVMRDSTFSQDSYLQLSELQSVINWKTIQATDGSLIDRNHLQFAEWFHQKNLTPEEIHNREILLSRLAEGSSIEQTLGLLTLHQAGLVSFGPQGEIICDLEKFRHSNWKDSGLISKLGRYIESSGTAVNTKNGVVKVADYLFQLFDGLEVYDSQSATENNLGEPQPLFIIPPDGNCTFSATEVKSWRGLMGVWEVSRQNIPAAYPTLEDGFASSISFLQTRTAITLWHDRYGAGERDPLTDELLLRYGESDVKRRSSWKFFPSHGLSGTRNDVISSHPWPWIKRYAKGLIQPDGLHPGDFRVISGYGAEDERVIRRPTTEKGTYNFDGVQYFLGVQYGKDTNWGIELEKHNTVAIVEEIDGKRVVKGILRLADRKDKTLFPDGKYESINRKKAQFAVVDELVENSSNYSELIEDFDNFLEFSDRLKQTEYGEINLATLSDREQLLAWKVAKKYGDNPQFWEFIKEYGVNGEKKSNSLRTFLLADAELANAKAFLEIGSNRLGPMIIEKIADIVDTVSSCEQKLINQPGITQREKLLANEINEIIFHQTGSLLTAAVAGANGELPWVSMSRIGDALTCLSEQVKETYYQRFLLEQESLYSEMESAYINAGESDHGREAVLRVFGQQLLRRVESFKNANDPHGAETALEQMTIFHETHPEAILDRADMFFGNNHWLLYRVLARAQFEPENKLKVIGTVLATANIGDELDTLDKIIRDQEIPQTERDQCQWMKNQIVGAQAPDITTFYQEFDYGNFKSHRESIDRGNQAILDRLHALGVTSQSRIRDLGSGLGELVNLLRNSGFEDVRGLDVTIFSYLLPEIDGSPISNIMIPPGFSLAFNINNAWRFCFSPTR